MNISEQDISPGPPRPCPKAVQISGMIWIIAGGLVFAAPASWVAYLVFKEGIANGLDAVLRGLVFDGWILAIVLLLAAYPASIIIRVGLRYVRGRARDTLWLGISSLVFGLLNCAVWIWPFLLAATGLIDGRGGRMSDYLAVVITGSGMTVAVSFLAAGVLSLFARRAYRDWHAALVINKDG
jgi:hypothetical protein